MRKWLLAVVIMGLPACDDGGAGAETPRHDDASTHADAQPDADPDGATGPDTAAPTASAAGTIVDVDGQPLPGAKVLACTPLTCFTTEAGQDGTFVAEGLPVMAHKMQVVGESLGLATALYYQEVVAGQVVTAPRPIVLSPLDADAQPWTTADGGTVTLAGGRLRLGAAAGVVKYPLGHFDQQVRGAQVAAEDLPPLDVEPWIGKEAGTLAFTVSPEPVVAKAGAFEVQVLDVSATEVGATYRVYGVASETAELEELGRAEVGADGTLSLTQGEITWLTTLIFVPDAP